MGDEKLQKTITHFRLPLSTFRAVGAAAESMCMSRADVMRLAISMGLPVVMERMSKPATTPGATA